MCGNLVIEYVQKSSRRFNLRGEMYCFSGRDFSMFFYSV